MMQFTKDKEERKAQKEELRKEFIDYDPVHHDCFVMKHNQKEDQEMTRQYMVNRGIIDGDRPGFCG